MCVCVCTYVCTCVRVLLSNNFDGKTIKSLQSLFDSILNLPLKEIIKSISSCTLSIHVQVDTNSSNR